MSQFDWPIAKKKLKLWRLLKIEDSMERWSAMTLWPRYKGEKGKTLGKTYGIKVRYYWEHIGSPLRTCWEQWKNEKKSSPNQNLKENKSRHFECIRRTQHEAECNGRSQNDKCSPKTLFPCKLGESFLYI
jgi:hypothetical protein